MCLRRATTPPAPQRSQRFLTHSPLAMIPLIIRNHHPHLHTWRARPRPSHKCRKHPNGERVCYWCRCAWAWRNSIRTTYVLVSKLCGKLPFVFRNSLCVCGHCFDTKVSPKFHQYKPSVERICSWCHYAWLWQNSTRVHVWLREQTLRQFAFCFSCCSWCLRFHCFYTKVSPKVRLSNSLLDRHKRSDVASHKCCNHLNGERVKYWCHCAWVCRNSIRIMYVSASK